MYSIMSGSTRVKRSVNFIASLCRVPLPLPPMLVWSVKLRRLDDERVAFPVSARVAHPLADALVEVRLSTVGRNDAGVVDHLVADRHDARVLDDAHAVAVDDGQRRAEHAARDDSGRRA